MKSLKEIKFFGGRVMKTGIASSLTAWICLSLDLPVMFAVITAIVTTEPTAADSIRKGLIRFPAAAIGAALAMGFSFLFDNTPITYGLAAMFTILICHRLHLDAGILVATLTAVAMIPGTTDHYFEAFALRLGTTSIGIVVSTLVNFFIMPPKFSSMLTNKVDVLYEEAGQLLKAVCDQIVTEEKLFTGSRKYQKLSREFERTFLLKQYQREEWKYRRHNIHDIRSFSFSEKKLTYLQKILYHIGNLQFVKLEEEQLTEEEKLFYLETAQSITDILRDPDHRVSVKHFTLIQRLDDEFRKAKQETSLSTESRYHHQFSGKTVLTYELLSLHDVIEDLAYICKREDTYA
ncbi:FUSC family protein [Bacillus taeanensis]|uniref:Aromatic acid exporter family protein n=1 Tax=Bacillus taeanensis TaxID=273032 RepID=A0A366XWH9_9BACI|nr:aromatic acid exporter family protein [Bacillus taeanensis]RBW69129.1 aromatic acid exporter family protein [Bacillus taeanensis]